MLQGRPRAISPRFHVLGFQVHFPMRKRDLNPLKRTDVTLRLRILRHKSFNPWAPAGCGQHTIILGLRKIGNLNLRTLSLRNCAIANGTDAVCVCGSSETKLVYTRSLENTLSFCRSVSLLWGISKKVAGDRGLSPEFLSSSWVCYCRCSDKGELQSWGHPRVKSNSPSFNAV